MSQNKKENSKLKKIIINRQTLGTNVNKAHNECSPLCPFLSPSSSFETVYASVCLSIAFISIILIVIIGKFCVAHCGA